RDRIAAGCGGDRLLYVAYGEAMAGERCPIRRDFEVVAVLDALGICAAGARNLSRHGLNLARQPIDAGEVWPVYLDPDRRADAGREHVDARLDRHRPGITNSRKLQRLVHLCDQRIDRHTGTPFGLWFEVDDGLE